MILSLFILVICCAIAEVVLIVIFIKEGLEQRWREQQLDLELAEEWEAWEKRHQST